MLGLESCKIWYGSSILLLRGSELTNAFVGSQAANASNVVFVSVRNKAKSTHLNEVVAKSTGNIHVLEADVVDHRALKVWTCADYLPEAC